MRSFVITLVIAAIMLTGSVIYTKHLSKESDNLVALTQSIKDAINNDDFDAAKTQIDKLHDRVSDFERFFLATGDHLEVDNIKINLEELKSFAEHENKSDALSKVYVLEFLFEHLPANSRLRIVNIL